MLVLDNLLAVCFVIFSFTVLLHYGEGMDWQEAIETAKNYHCSHPIVTSLIFIIAIPFYWRPIKHTKLMPFSHYVNDLALMIFIVFPCLYLTMMFMMLKSHGSFSFDDTPYWVSCLQYTTFISLFCYRRIFLMFVSKKNTIKSLFGTSGNEKDGNGDESQSPNSTLWGDFKFFVFGTRKEGVPAESLTYKLTPRRISIILDNLIAPAACYYFSVWMRRLYYGVDCSFEAVVEDIFLDKDYGNIIILYLVMLVLFWRTLWHNDKKPYWPNFKETGCYYLIAFFSAFIIFFVCLNYIILIEDGRMQAYTYYNRERGIYHFEHYVPLWIDIIRVIGIVTIFMVRRFLLQDGEESFKGEKHPSDEPQQK